MYTRIHIPEGTFLYGETKWADESGTNLSLGNAAGLGVE